VKTSIVRLAQIHDTHKQGLVPYLLAVSRQKGISAYLGDGGNRWPAAHVSDTALLYRLAFEKAEAGAIYHAVDEEGVTMKAIAEAHGRGLKIPVVSIKPEEAGEHFGWLAVFAKADMRRSTKNKKGTDDFSRRSTAQHRTNVEVYPKLRALSSSHPCPATTTRIGPSPFKRARRASFASNSYIRNRAGSVKRPQSDSTG